MRQTVMRGQRRITDAGYIEVRAIGHPLARYRGWLKEHRKIAWDAGLITDPAQVVHHINENRQDNRLENLEVLPKGSHSAHHWDADKMRAGQNARKTHCPAGHPYDGANTYVNPHGERSCRTCRKELRQRRDAARGERNPE